MLNRLIFPYLYAGLLQSVAAGFTRWRKVGTTQSTMLPNGKVPFRGQQQVPQKITATLLVW
jgi:hypothetical protein